ncbi:tail fiber domain-containing protein [Candidatus Margulisiibacteriota bacterium]
MVTTKMLKQTKHLIIMLLLIVISTVLIKSGISIKPGDSYDIGETILLEQAQDGSGKIILGQHLTLDATGNVGIGTTAPGLFAKLHIVDTSSAHVGHIIQTNDAVAGMEIESQSVTDVGEVIMNIGVHTNRGIPDISGNPAGAWFRIDTRVEEPVYSWFYEAPSGETETELMTLNMATGRLGIGHTNPGSKLTVSGGISATTLDTGYGANELWDMDQHVKTTSAVSFATIDTGYGANELWDMDQHVKTTSAVSFATVDTGQGANDLWDMDQNVTTGSDVTFSKLNTGDGFYLSNGSFFKTGSQHAYISCGGTSGARFFFQRNGTTVFELYTYGEFKSTSIRDKDATLGGYATVVVRDSDGMLGIVPSSREAKANITDFDASYIYLLEPKQYNYRKQLSDLGLLEEGEENAYTDQVHPKINYGFIAEDVLNINPNLVSYRPIRDEEENIIDHKISGLNKLDIIPALVKIVQEQKSKIDELENRLSVLEYQ